MSMLNHFFNYKPEVLALDEKAMELGQPYFRHMEEIRDFNQLKKMCIRDRDQGDLDYREGMHPALVEPMPTVQRHAV